MTSGGAPGADDGPVGVPVSRREHRLGRRRRRRLAAGGLLVIVTLLAAAVTMLGLRREPPKTTPTSAPSGAPADNLTRPAAGAPAA
jgi:hypothetical protein